MPWPCRRSRRAGRPARRGRQCGNYAARHRARAAPAERTKAALNEAKRKLAERDDKKPRPLTILATERGRHGPSPAFVRRGARAAKRRARPI